MTVTIVQDRHQKPCHPRSHQLQEVEVRREKGVSETEASLGWEDQSTAVQKLLEKYLH